jgi:YegS/Rv2252/BmrU family lipid kinase
MLKKNVILIVNPVSGGNDKAELIETVALFTAEKGRNFILFETSGNNDSLEIKKLYQKHLPERIIIAGGDGTIKLVAEALADEDILFGLLPAGSANGLATDLGLPETMHENLEIGFGSKFMEIDMVLINDNLSLHLSDLGLNAELIKNYENSAVRGKWGYAVQVFNTLMDREDPFIATIKANGEIIECEARMIVIANSQKYGTGIVINPDGVMNDGKFELVILKNLDLVVISKIMTGNMPVDFDDIQIISTNKAVITTNNPVSFQIDGEYCGQKKALDIAIAPSKIKVAIP